MTPAVDVVTPATSIGDAARHMRDGDVGALPVGNDDRLVGMVTDRDIALRGVAEDKASDACTVGQVMSEGIYYCFEDDDAGRAADAMAEHQVRRLPVLNRDKRLVGIVALADLALAGLPQPAIGEVSEPTRDARH